MKRIRMMTTSETGKFILGELGVGIDLYFDGAIQQHKITELTERFPFQSLGEMYPGSVVILRVYVPRSLKGRLIVAKRKQFPNYEHYFEELKNVAPNNGVEIFEYRWRIGKKGLVLWPYNQIYLIFAGRTTINFFKVCLCFQVNPETQRSEAFFVLQHQYSGDIAMVRSPENLEWIDRRGNMHELSEGGNFICQTPGFEMYIDGLKFFKDTFDENIVPEIPFEELNLFELIERLPYEFILNPHKDEEVEEVSMVRNNGLVEEYIRVRKDLLNGKPLYTGVCGLTTFNFASNTGFGYIETPLGKKVLVKIHYSQLPMRPVYVTDESSLERFRCRFFEPGEVLYSEKIEFRLHTQGPKAGHPRWEARGLTLPLEESEQKIYFDDTWFNKIKNDL